ncbi:MAG: CpsD/CapB family tyrosine-protein kinase [Ruminococcaceae bacterium]|nr:CpsD/CapB family tyrosine-protein kinase [Oscillospiraceae bacterium]
MRKMPEMPTVPLISGKVPFEYAEAYKALRTNFTHMAENGENRKLLVTSSVPEEGKSSVAINFAISLAQVGKRVLLIDADLRKPSVNMYLNIRKNPEKNVVTVLAGMAELAESVVETVHGFDVLIGGVTPPNPAELVSSQAMVDLMDQALETYDFVIVDTPPVGLVTDAAALASLCDGVVFVIRQGFAKKNIVQGAVHKLQTVNAKIVGTVINQYNLEDASTKDYSYYGHYGKYGKYGQYGK